MTRQQMRSLAAELTARRRDRERAMALEASLRALREKRLREAAQHQQMTARAHASRVGA